jgi:hypothetical protein
LIDKILSPTDRLLTGNSGFGSLILTRSGSNLILTGNTGDLQLAPVGDVLLDDNDLKLTGTARQSIGTALPNNAILLNAILADTLPNTRLVGGLFNISNTGFSNATTTALSLTSVSSGVGSLSAVGADINVICTSGSEAVGIDVDVTGNTGVAIDALGRASGGTSTYGDSIRASVSGTAEMARGIVTNGGTGTTRQYSLVAESGIAIETGNANAFEIWVGSDVITEIDDGNVAVFHVDGTDGSLTIQDRTTGTDYFNVDAANTGVTTILGLATGGLTDYDLKVGDTTTPDYGMMQIGNATFGRTSYNVGNLDLDGSLLLWNNGTPATSNIEFAFAESANTIRFAIPKSGVGNATYNPRSMLIAGPAVLDDTIVTVGYWQGQGIFDNLVCDTSGDGADLGVQNDLEVEGDLFIDDIRESTSAAGVTFYNQVILDDTADATLSIGTTTADNVIQIGELQGKNQFMGFTGTGSFSGPSGNWGWGDWAITNTNVGSTGTGSGLVASMTTSQAGGVHQAMTLANVATSHTASTLRGLNISVQGNQSGSDAVDGGFFSISSGNRTAGYLMGLGRGATGFPLSPSSGDCVGFKTRILTDDTTGRAIFYECVRGATTPTVTYAMISDGDFVPVTDATDDIGSGSLQYNDIYFSNQLVYGSAQTYSVSNVTTDRTYDANATTINELADVLGTLIADLRTIGLVA